MVVNLAFVAAALGVFAVALTVVATGLESLLATLLTSFSRK